MTIMPTHNRRIEHPPNYLNAGYTAKSWLLTTDHKRIAHPLPGFGHVLLFHRRRVRRAHPAGPARPRPATWCSAETYNKLFTMHGIIMIFFFLIPAIPAVLGNFLIPIMIGARDLAFPKLNLLSWYIYMLGGIFSLYRGDHRRRGYRLDVLHPVQQHVRQHQRHARGAGRLHHRLLVHPHRPQLHRHHPQACGRRG